MLHQKIYFFKAFDIHNRFQETNKSMEDIEEIPAKRRKTEEVSEQNGDSSSLNYEKVAKVKSPLNLQIKPTALARLRQIAKSSPIISGACSPQKQTDQQKDDSDVAIETTNTHDQNQDEEKKDTSDVIISSAGSSSPNSPKPEDLVVLSTPPKKAFKLHHHIDSEKVSKRLSDHLDQLEKQRVTSRNELKDEVLTDDKKPSNEQKVENGKTSKVTSSQQQPFNLDSVELKKVLRAMIDEKFKQVEDIYQNQNSEAVLLERINRLEEENRNLQEYAAKLEKAVKLLLDNQKTKKERQSKSVQTESIVLPKTKSVTPSSPVAQVPAPAKPSIPVTLTSKPPGQTPQEVNQVNKQGTQVTSRLTATQAAIPGHSVTPASLPQRAMYTQQQIRVTSPMVVRPSQPQRPSHYASGVNQLSVPTSPTRRPAPVTVTVHPQTTTTTMIPSPSYPAQPQKTTYITNSVANQPLQPRLPVAHPPQQVQRLPGTQPMVVYQRPPAPQQAPQVQPTQHYTNSLRSPSSSRQSGTTVPLQPQAGNVNNQTRTLQNPTSNFQQVRPHNPGVANHEQSNNYLPKELPGKPVVSIAVVSNGIVLSWNMHTTPSTTRIARYQLFALQDAGTSAAQWKKIGVVNALPLPMACTLTQFMPGNKYHFTVRAQDEHGRCGPLSEPCTVTLT